MCPEPRGGTCESAGRDVNALSEAGGGAAGGEEVAAGRGGEDSEGVNVWRIEKKEVRTEELSG